MSRFSPTAKGCCKKQESTPCLIGTSGWNYDDPIEKREYSAMQCRAKCLHCIRTMGDANPHRYAQESKQISNLVKTNLFA
jgi:hypothetical protein